MVERDINFGSSETDAKYQISDDGAPGNFVLARDTNGDTVLLQWNATAGQWEYGGPVDMDGNDLVDAGTTVYDASTDTIGDGTTSADHTAVTTDLIDITDSGAKMSYGGSAQAVSTATATDLVWDTVNFEDTNAVDADTTNDQLVVQQDGRYYIAILARWLTDTNWSTGDLCRLQPQVNGSLVTAPIQLKVGTRFQSVSASTIVSLSATDVITGNVYQDSGSEQKISGDSSQNEILATKVA